MRMKPLPTRTTREPYQGRGSSVLTHTRAQAAIPTPETWEGSSAPAPIPAPTQQPAPKHTPTKPQPEQARSRRSPYPPARTASPDQGGRKAGRNPNPNTRQTRDRDQERLQQDERQNQAGAPHNSKKPSVHSPDTEAACAMQVTWRNLLQRPGLRLHPEANASLGLKAERATPKHPGTRVPRPRRRRALGTGYARKSGEPPEFRPKRGTCASTGAHPPGVTSTSQWQRLALPVLPDAAFMGATSQL